jgi:hypothetical protein
VFRCFPSSSKAVAFRALLQGGGTTLSRAEIASCVGQWISNDITIRVQSLILINVDSECTVVISSFDDEECQINSEQPTNNSLLAVVGGTVAGLLLLLILSSVVITTLLTMFWWGKKHHGRYYIFSMYE